MVSKTFRVFYQLIPSALGEIGMLWVQKNAGPLIMHIMLPQKNIPITKTISKNWPGALKQSHEKLKKLCLQIQNFLKGSPVSFSLEFIDITVCYDFQKKVLLETRQIPRGKAISYGRLADRILAPGAARAVGSALARNPFPLIIPCHRVIKSAGYLGNFSGGPEMKKFLLQMEGVPSNTRGKIGPKYFQK
ncbi:MAG: methylated-DNA--[protein]-cysteine S-methyltransferase [Thermodesulfobacteriota bacterium]|nr:methylated-DNA--[protein]-cysteine S-methyltransferase [Thermodesulfobacteriota bacterium]